MYIAFFQDKLIRGELHGNVITPLTTQLTGQAFADCYNYTKNLLLPDGNLDSVVETIGLSEETIQKIPSICEEFWQEKIAQAKTDMNADDAERYAWAAVLREAWKASVELSRFLPCVNQEKSSQAKPIPLELNLMSVQATMFFAKYENQVVQVYNISSLYEYLYLDFYQSLSGTFTTNFAICPCCGKLFRKTRKDHQYCSAYCKKKVCIQRNNQNPYIAAYRYMQQYCNRQLNVLRKKKGNSHPDTIEMEEAYEKWLAWARQQRDRMHYTPGDDEKVIRKAFIQDLTMKWKGLTQGIEN